MGKKFSEIVCVCAVIVGVILMSHFSLSGDGGSGNGSGLQEGPGVAYIPEDAVFVEVSYAHGEITTWKVTGGALDALREWANGLRCHHVKFAEGETPGDSDGGASYSFAMTGNASGFSYVMNGGDENYLLTEGKWYKVENPSPPPVD